MSIPPTEIFTKSTANVAYLNFSEGVLEKNRSLNVSAVIVMAAGSVIKPPNNGPNANIRMKKNSSLNRPPMPDIFERVLSAKESTGHVDAMIIMTTTKNGSI